MNLRGLWSEGPMKNVVNWMRDSQVHSSSRIASLERVCGQVVSRDVYAMNEGSDLAPGVPEMSSRSRGIYLSHCRNKLLVGILVF